MTEGGIRIGAAPSEDRSTIDNQIAGANQPTTDGGQDAEDKERFRQRGSCLLATLALLRRAGDARVTIFPERQAACQGKGRPRVQPVTHILSLRAATASARAQ